jgi:hypothetical protein
VRDVAISNGILFVCDEPDAVVNMYALDDGTFIGSSNALTGKPTHAAIQNGGLYVSAGPQLYWGQVPSSVNSASLSLASVFPSPSGENIGGVSFAGGAAAGTLYMSFQAATGKAEGGSICTYTVTQTSPSTAPVFSNPAEFASGFKDTPEFVLYMPS